MAVLHYFRLFFLVFCYVLFLDPFRLLILHILGQQALSFFNIIHTYVVIHPFPSWLVWGKIQVYCACCAAQMAHKIGSVNLISKVDSRH
jgi:hypothetical protein